MLLPEVCQYLVCAYLRDSSISHDRDARSAADIFYIPPHLGWVATNMKLILSRLAKHTLLVEPTHGRHGNKIPSIAKPQQGNLL